MGSELLSALHAKRCTAQTVELGGKDENGDQAVLITSPYDKDKHLQLSRALGDSNFKQPAKAASAKRPRSSATARAAVTAEPKSMSEDAALVAFVVLCSDGVTDHLGDGEIVSLVAEHVRGGGKREAAAAVLHARATERAAFKGMTSSAELRALAPGSDRRRIVDDMTAIVVFFGPASAAAGASVLSPQ